MNIEMIGTIINVAVILFATYFSSKVLVNEKVKALVPYGVEYANTLVEKTNREKLIKAVAFIEITLINAVPNVFKPIIDYLINSEEIVKHIERYLLKIKIDKD